jgi:hypothetical protein
MLRLRSTAGVMVPGRCRATRLCDYCAKLAAVETSEVLMLDALNGSSPALWMVLTTRETNPDLPRVKRARAKLVKAIRRRWPAA